MSEPEAAPVAVHRLAPDQAPAAWPAIEGFVREALAHGEGRYEPVDYLVEILTGRRDLWLVLRDGSPCAVAIGAVVQYPRKRVYAVPVIGGRLMREWLPTLQRMIEDFARHCGCTQLEGNGRGGWARAAGFRASGQHLLKDV